jgi:uncharacterized protein (TIGR00730 family)
MGVVADSTLAAGGQVIGIIPQQLVDYEIAHTGLTELQVVSSMHERKKRMADLADAFIALPGGFGTIEEFCEELELPFDLIADPDKKVHRAYGFKEMVRALILVGKDGKILYANKKFDLKEESWKALMKEVEALKPKK